MYAELLNLYWKDYITIDDIFNGKIDREKFQLSGFRVFGNEALNFFHEEKKLDLYVTLHNHLSICERQHLHSGKRGIAYVNYNFDVFNNHIAVTKSNGLSIRMEIDDFLRQMRAPIPELATMMYFLDTGEAKRFEDVDDTLRLVSELDYKFDRNE